MAEVTHFPAATPAGPSLPERIRSHKLAIAYREQIPNGELRRCKVLEINKGNALVQLFESSASLAMPPPVPPRVNAGRTMTG